jgi:alpha-glucosidase
MGRIRRLPPADAENHDNGDYRGYEEELYTEWFANACWFDVPVRPHTDNQFRRVNPPYDTAPDLVGKKASNLANLRQRYELIPYYYSLAYRAHLAGEPVVPPLVFYYQDDPAVRTIGHEKLIGRDLLVGVVARHGEFERDVYLPKGKWADYYSHEWVNSIGAPSATCPTYREDLFRLPVFARAGAMCRRCMTNTLDSAGTAALAQRIVMSRHSGLCRHRGLELYLV